MKVTFPFVIFEINIGFFQQTKDFNVSDAAPYIAGIAAFSTIIGALVTIRQTDMKRLIAYSSVSHMGYVLLGMAAVVSTESAGAEAGLNGAVMQMFNHGVITAMLFLLVGMLYDRAHHRWIAFPDDYDKPELAGQLGFGGVSNRMPVYSAFVMVAFFAGLGLPGLSGFISEAFCFIGGFTVFRFLTVIGTLGILLYAVYFLRAYQRILWGEEGASSKELTDINLREIFILITSYLSISNK